MLLVWRVRWSLYQWNPSSPNSSIQNIDAHTCIDMNSPETRRHSRRPAPGGSPRWRVRAVLRRSPGAAATPPSRCCSPRCTPPVSAAALPALRGPRTNTKLLSIERYEVIDSRLEGVGIYRKATLLLLLRFCARELVINGRVVWFLRRESFFPGGKGE